MPQHTLNVKMANVQIEEEEYCRRTSDDDRYKFDIEARVKQEEYYDYNAEQEFDNAPCAINGVCNLHVVEPRKYMADIVKQEDIRNCDEGNEHNASGVKQECNGEDQTNNEVTFFHNLAVPITIVASHVSESNLELSRRLPFPIPVAIHCYGTHEMDRSGFTQSTMDIDCTEQPSTSSAHDDSCHKPRNTQVVSESSSPASNRSYTVVQPYRCNRCNYSCATSSLLTKHKRAYASKKPYRCGQCHLSAATLSQLKVHKRIHSGEKPYTCEVCNYRCTSSSRLKIHKRTHTGERPYQCGQCQFSVATLSQLKEHKRIHSGEKPFTCEVCNYSCTSSSRLKIHKRSHSGERPYQCDDCDYCTTNASTLTVHKRTHTGERPYPCVQCQFSAVTSSQLTVHKRIHSGEKPYRCNICNYSCTTAGCLVLHKRRRHQQRNDCDFFAINVRNLTLYKSNDTKEKLYRCDQCDFSCTLSGNSTKHQCTRENTYPGARRYPCDVCDYAAKCESHLVVHKRSHTGEKPYPCDQCSYASARRGDLVKHKRVHSGEKPYRCDYCPYAARCSSRLVRHKRTHVGV